jgi:hypothetical protein
MQAMPTPQDSIASEAKSAAAKHSPVVQRVHVHALGHAPRRPSQTTTLPGRNPPRPQDCLSLDGIHFGIRSDEAPLCAPVVTGVNVRWQTSPKSPTTQVAISCSFVSASRQYDAGACI